MNAWRSAWAWSEEGSAIPGSLDRGGGAVQDAEPGKRVLQSAWVWNEDGSLHNFCKLFFITLKINTTTFDFTVFLPYISFLIRTISSSKLKKHEQTGIRPHS